MKIVKKINFGGAFSRHLLQSFLLLAISLLEAPIVKNCHIFSGVYFIFSQNVLKQKFKAFQNQALISVKRSDFYVK